MPGVEAQDGGRVMAACGHCALAFFFASPSTSWSSLFMTISFLIHVTIFLLAMFMVSQSLAEASLDPLDPSRRGRDRPAA